MKRRAFILVIPVFMLGAAVLLLLLPQQETTADRIIHEDVRPESRPTLAQAYSSKCSTQSGICLVPPLPIGSPCSCGDYAGTIIP